MTFELRTTMTRRRALAVAGVSLACLTSTRALAGPLKIRFSWSSVPTELQPIYFEMTDVLKHYGKSYTIDLIRVRGSGQQITALAAGELDFAGLAPSTLVLAVKNAKLNDIRIVMDSGQDGVNGYFSNQFLVRADSPINKVSDLKGKIVASNGIGGATDMAMRKLLANNGLSADRDVKVVEIDFANMLPALMEKRIDMASVTLPFAYYAKKEGKTRVIGTVADAIGPNQKNFLVARAGFIAANRDVVVDMMEDMLLAHQWLLDPKNRSAAINLIAKFNKSSPELFDWVFTKDDAYREPNLRPNLGFIKSSMEEMNKLGVFKDTIDVDQFSDLTLLDAAIHRLQA